MKQLSSDWFQGAIVVGLVVFVLMGVSANRMVEKGKMETCRQMVAELDLETRLNQEIYCYDYAD